MAIALTRRRKGQPLETTRIVPIATQAVFDSHWAPAIRALTLQWVPLFRTGIPVEPEDLNSIIDELTLLRKSIKDSGGETAEGVLPRLDRLIAELKLLRRDSAVEAYDIYIG